MDGRWNGIFLSGAGPAVSPAVPTPVVEAGRALSFMDCLPLVSPQRPPAAC